MKTSRRTTEVLLVVILVLLVAFWLPYLAPDKSPIERAVLLIGLCLAGVAVWRGLRSLVSRRDEPPAGTGSNRGQTP
jgi:hypothetical protein